MNHQMFAGYCSICGQEINSDDNTVFDGVLLYHLYCYFNKDNLYTDRTYTGYYI